MVGDTPCVVPMSFGSRAHVVRVVADVDFGEDVSSVIEVGEAG